MGWAVVTSHPSGPLLVLIHQSRTLASPGKRLGWQTWEQVQGQIRSVAQSCPTLCDPMDCSTPGFSVHHQLSVQFSRSVMSDSL